MTPVARLKRFFTRCDGSASVEFVILFPLFISIMLMSVESGIYMARQVLLDRSVDIAVRDLRLGTDDPPSFYEFKDQICANSMLIADCDDVIQIELRPVDLTTWTGVTGDPLCRDVTQNIDPYDPEKYQSGAENELMMVQVCALYRPMFPTTYLGLGLQFVTGGYYAIVVKSGFVNEPSS